MLSNPYIPTHIHTCMHKKCVLILLLRASRASQHYAQHGCLLRKGLALQLKVYMAKSQDPMNLRELSQI